MARKSVLAIASALLLCSAPLMAGGPPRLSLPIVGVTTNNVDACAKTLAAKLKNKIWQPSGESRTVQIQQGLNNQWYVMFPLAKDVGLREVEAALSSCGLSIPHDRLRLFGHVFLEIESPVASSKELSSELDALKFVSIHKVAANEKDNRLVVTIEMPYPVDLRRPDSNPLESETFRRLDLGSDKLASSEEVATPQTLPSYKTLTDVVAKHQAKLIDIRWSTEFACRVVGGVAVSEPARTAQAIRTK